MESTQNRLAYLFLYLGLGPQGTEKEEEKESYQEASDRLWAQLPDLTEEEFSHRLAELSALADQEAALNEPTGCPICPDGSCDLCAFLDSLDEPTSAGAASLDYEGLGEFESSYWQHRNSGAPRRSNSYSGAKLKP
ncbi:MAG: hypothetical protein EOO37_00030 [Cytophagaceae bacterium]|nr:MAG: hypothetical protein EOO37_00030 [Cytophagaceae bacterium]